MVGLLLPEVFERFLRLRSQVLGREQSVSEEGSAALLQPRQLLSVPILQNDVGSIAAALSGLYLSPWQFQRLKPSLLDILLVIAKL